MTDQQLLDLLRNEAIPNQELIIKLMEEKLKLLNEIPSDENDALFALKTKHLKLIENKITEIEMKMKKN